MNNIFLIFFVLKIHEYDFHGSQLFPTNPFCDYEEVDPVWNFLEHVLKKKTTDQGMIPLVGPWVFKV